MDGNVAFILEPPAPSKERAPRRRRAAGGLDLSKASTAIFRLEPHVCRICFGRVVSSQRKDEARVYRCTNCGAGATGAHAKVICACGMKVGAKDAGVRCIVNETPTPELPNEIIAKEQR